MKRRRSRERKSEERVVVMSLGEVFFKCCDIKGPLVTIWFSFDA